MAAVIQEQDGSPGAAAAGTAIADFVTAAESEQLLLTSLSDSKDTIDELVGSEQQSLFLQCHCLHVFADLLLNALLRGLLQNCCSPAMRFVKDVFWLCWQLVS